MMKVCLVEGQERDKCVRKSRRDNRERKEASASDSNSPQSWGAPGCQRQTIVAGFSFGGGNGWSAFEFGGAPRVEGIGGVDLAGLSSGTDSELPADFRSCLYRYRRRFLYSDADMDVDGLASDVDAGEIRWLAFDADVALENHARILDRLRVLLWLMLFFAGDIDVLTRKDNSLMLVSRSFPAHGYRRYSPLGI